MQILRKGDKGNEVKTLQRKLQAQGFLSDGVDGDFGKNTHEAVVYFQMTHLDKRGRPLEVDGIVGEDTWWALDNPSGDAQISGIEPRIPFGLTPARQLLLGLALYEHGMKVRERPDGSNRSERIDVYTGYTRRLSNTKGPAWCCFFVHYIWKQLDIHIDTWPGHYPFGARTGSTWKAWKAAEDAEVYFDKTFHPVIPGDCFLMQYKDERGRWKHRGHIGFVLRVEKSTGGDIRFNTVEGNCGNRVKVGLRSITEPSLIGFINPFPENEQPTNFETGIMEASGVGGSSTL